MVAVYGIYTPCVNCQLTPLVPFGCTNTFMESNGEDMLPPPRLRTLHESVWNASHALQHVQLALLGYYPVLPVGHSFVSQAGIKSSFIVVIECQSGIGVTHAVPVVSVHGHSQTMCSCTWTQVGREREGSCCLSVGQCRRHLVPVLYSSTYASCYNDVGELQIIQQLILFCARIIQLHTNLGNCYRSSAVDVAAIKRFLYLQAALEHVP